MRLNHWIYVAIVLVGTIGLATAAAVIDARIQIAGNLFAAALTHPAGLIAQGLSLPLVYMGIASQEEALALCAPIYAFAGYLQWYVLLPRFLRRKNA